MEPLSVSIIKTDSVDENLNPIKDYFLEIYFKIDNYRFCADSDTDLFIKALKEESMDILEEFIYENFSKATALKILNHLKNVCKNFLDCGDKIYLLK